MRTIKNIQEIKAIYEGITRENKKKNFADVISKKIYIFWQFYKEILDNSKMAENIEYNYLRDANAMQNGVSFFDNNTHDVIAYNLYTPCPIIYGKCSKKYYVEKLTTYKMIDGAMVYP